MTNTSSCVFKGYAGVRRNFNDAVVNIPEEYFNREEGSSEPSQSNAILCSSSTFELHCAVNCVGVLPVRWDPNNLRIYVDKKWPKISKCVLAVGLELVGVFFLLGTLAKEFTSPDQELRFFWVIGQITLLCLYFVSLLIGWHIFRNLNKFIWLINDSMKLYRDFERSISRMIRASGSDLGPRTTISPGRILHIVFYGGLATSFLAPFLFFNDPTFSKGFLYITCSFDGSEKNEFFQSPQSSSPEFVAASSLSIFHKAILTFFYFIFVYIELIHFSFVFLLLVPYVAAMAPTFSLLHKSIMRQFAMLNDRDTISWSFLALNEYQKLRVLFIHLNEFYGTFVNSYAKAVTIICFTGINFACIHMSPDPYVKTMLIGPAALGQYILILGFGAAATVHSVSERFLQIFSDKVAYQANSLRNRRSDLNFLMKKLGGQKALCFHIGKLSHFQRMTSLNALECAWNYTITLVITFSN